MNAKRILDELEQLHYWDARVLQLDSDFFGDEITLLFEDSDFNIKLTFTGCSKFNFETSSEDRLMPLKNLTKAQIPYFIQDIDLIDVNADGMNLMKCTILMPPMSVEIICREINVEKSI